LNLIRVMPAEGDEMREPDLTAQSQDLPIDALPGIAADIMARLRARTPRVHCLTNAVAQTFTANVLLAAGAIPSMTIATDEIGAFVARADALLVNLGTFDSQRRDAAEIAIAQAHGGGTPWVLDPVFIEKSPARAAFARQLATCDPAVIRLNAAEFAALMEEETTRDAMLRWARDNVALAVTGAVDLVTDGARALEIANGHPYMSQVTAMGDAASALIAACLAVEPDPLLASAAALLAFAVAGEIAAERARGPGSFAVEIIDALHRLDEASLRNRGRVK
jgi:hydroxyethylthiazole kinase